MKPADIRAEIQRARAEMLRLLEYVEALERALTLKGGLTRMPKERSVSTVDVNGDGLSSYTKRAATRSNREHAGLKILYERNVTQSGLARELKESRSRVASWFAEGSLNRPIPRRHVTYLLKTYGVPESAWARIAD